MKSKYTCAWTKEETDSVVQLLKNRSSMREVVDEHNKVWKTNRSYDGIKTRLYTNQLPPVRDLLGENLKPTKPKETEVSETEKHIQNLISYLKKSTHSIEEVCNFLDLSPLRTRELVECAVKQGYKLKPVNDGKDLSIDYHVPRRSEITRLPISPIKSKVVFAAMGDPHFGSIHHDQAALEDFIQFAYKERNVRDVTISGDLLAGINMYRGQNNELVKWGEKSQVQMALDQLPSHQGLKFHCIGGNHDESYLKASGSDPLEAVAAKRNDFNYLGFYSALVDINKIRLELGHPEGAGGYAISYHLQKEIESIPGGMKPNIALYGHTHQSLLLPFYRNVCCFYVGCFESQSLYLKRKHIDPTIGGWIITVGLDETNALKSISTEFVHYFHGTRYIGNPTVSDTPSANVQKIR